MAKSKKTKEHHIRDHLAENLDLIEPGLALIDREVLLRNDKGAKGFLDIFARTASGKFLIIEVKRSDATAREAIQELVKYVALLRQNLLVKASEIELLVASTDWNELNVPFSEFARTSPYDCKGFVLELGEDGLTESVNPIELAAEERHRRISRRHFIWGFNNEKVARNAIPKIADHMQEVGLKDFVILLLEINHLGDPANRFLYFAQQELSLEEYMRLLRQQLTDIEFEDFQSYIDDFSEEEDKVGEAADKIWECDGALYSKLKPMEVQISHPEKARSWFASETLVSAEVLRFGRFKDIHITDEKIIEELQGNDGVSFNFADVKARVTSKPEMSEVIDTSENVFYYNPTWRTAINDLCNYAVRTNASTVHFRAFSNESILRTIAGIYIGRPEYAPYFHFEIMYEDRSELIFGTIEWDGTEPVFKKILDDYFEGDTFHYFMLEHLGAQRDINADLMAEMGLSYSIGQLIDDRPVPVRVQGASIKERKAQPHRFLANFPEGNKEFAGEVVEIFLKHDHSFSSLYEDAAFSFMERQLEQWVSETDWAIGQYWHGKIEKCDLCKRPMQNVRFMIDGPIAPGGAWGCVCAMCFGGGEIGWGKGQLYQQEDGSWRLVGGGRPHDEYGDE